MLKKIIPVTLFTLMPIAAFAADAGGAKVSGFADITYTNNNDSSLFLANAEVDIENKMSDKVSVRIDTDLSIAANGGTSLGSLDIEGAGPKDSAIIEQAFFAYSPMKGATIIGGVFNNPIGWEKEDAPDMYQINKGQIYGILDGQTIMYGNNVAGVAVASNVGPATVTVAVLNDIGNVQDKNSLAAVVNVTPMKGLDVELGYVTQDTQAGNVWDVNATYSVMGATVGVEMLGAEEAVDMAMGTTVNYAINPMFNVTVRYDSVSYQAAGADDTTSYAVAGAFNAAKNLTVLAEYADFDDDKVFALEFIASF